MNKYYVRVKATDVQKFEEHIARNNLTQYELLSNDFSTSMYSMMMDDEEALSLKLSFPLVGCLNIKRALGRLVDKR